METQENLLIDNDFEEYIENFEKEVNDNVENYYSCDEGASTYTVLKVGWDARKQFEKNIYRGNIGRLEFEVINQQSKIDSLEQKLAVAVEALEYLEEDYRDSRVAVICKDTLAKIKNKNEK